MAFNAFVLCEIVLSRGDIDPIHLDDEVIARAGGTREHFWQGVAVLFTTTRVIAYRRSVIYGTIRAPLTEASRSAVEMFHDRHGPFFDHVRCEWPDGIIMHLRVRSRDMRRLTLSIEPTPGLHTGPLRA